MEQLTKGCVAKYNSGAKVENGVLQCFQVRKIEGKPGTQTRYKLTVSDGQFYMSAMLTTANNYLVEENKLGNGTILRVNEYLLQPIADQRKILILMQLNIIKTNAPRIGEPKSFSESAGAAAPQAAAAQAPVPGERQAQIRHTGTSAYSAAARGAPVQRSPSGIRYTSIGDLNPYISNWTIKGRITKKTNVKYSNAKNPNGRILKLEICDKDSSTIQATLFNEDCDKWQEFTQEGKVYAFSNGRVKMANKRFNNCTSDYEISLGRDANIEAVQDDMTHVQVPYKRVRISDLETMAIPATVDIIAIVKEASPCQDIQSKKGLPLTKRDLMLVDESEASIKITLWGDHAKMEDASFEGNPVILAKGISISEYSGRSLSTYRSSTLLLNPDFAPEASKLSAWWSTGGSSSSVTQLTEARTGRVRTIENRRSLSAVENERLGTNEEKPDWMDTKAYVTFVRSERYCYPSDPVSKKKLIKDEISQKWRNEQENKEYDQPVYRYILSLQIADETGSRWVTAYDDEATIMMKGFTAGQLKQLEESGGEKAVRVKLNELLTFRNFKYTLKCAADTYQDEQRTRISVQRVEQINYRSENAELIKALSQYATVA